MASGGWLVLVGGGEFSFGETLEADRAWLEKVGPGPVGFVPAASGSADYPRHFSAYLKETFERDVELIPVYRARDGKRGRNAERVAACPAVYLGGGVTDHLLEAISGTPVHEALRAKLATGGVVVGIAAAAQACGRAARSVFAGRFVDGLDLAPGLGIEPNFDPGHDRRLRQLVARPGVERGIGLPAGSGLMLSGDGAFEAVGDVFTLAGEEADLVPLTSEAGDSPAGEGR